MNYCVSAQQGWPYDFLRVLPLLIDQKSLGVLHSTLISLMIHDELSGPELMLYFVSSLLTYYLAFIPWHFQDIFMCADVEGVFPYFISFSFWFTCMVGRI